MIIASQAQMQQWADQNIHIQVREWFENNEGKWISDCVTANPTISYEQVTWSLGFLANNMNQPLMALPQQDTELSLAMQLNGLYKG